MVIEYKIQSVSFTGLCDLLDTGEWIAVYLPTQDYKYKDMMIWLDTYCEKRVRFLAAAFVFEDAQDAIIFKLRWS
jgi:hypothetical protein